jgi:hypothetical protein
LGISEDAQIAVIAHEFAHVFLNQMDANLDDEEAQAMEDEADEQVSKWGFGKELSTFHETQKKLGLGIRF